ncbi:MAG: HAMP domain-containing protein, partial [Deltaproteobacteria bacterium]|nr:HAMP domain-containing protein [Deltaproteobacteria bacterium]
MSSLLAFFAIYYQITSIVADRTDEELVESIEEFSTLLSSQGIDEAKRMMVDEARDDGESKIFYRLLALDGKELAASNLSSWKNVQIDRIAVDAIIHGAKNILQTVAIADRRHDARIVYGRIGPEHILQVGWSLEEDDEFAEPFREILAATLGGVMILAALAGWIMAKRALAGVAEVTRTAREISVGDLARRVTVKSNAHEIEELATTFNDMLDRIERLVTEMTEMNDNIAHDLRSPITRIRGIAEMTLTYETSID